MRPRELQIGLQTGSGDLGSAGGQAGTRRHRQIPRLRKRAELPFDGRRHIAEAAGRIALQAAEIIRHVDQKFQAWGNAQPQPAIGAIESLFGSAPGCVDTVLALQAAHGNDEAGIGNIGPVGGDLRAGTRALAGVGNRRRAHGYEKHSQGRGERPAPGVDG